ncbi:MAG: hypothetical protein ACREP6_02395 [Candidatus Binataceae bacterium]
MIGKRPRLIGLAIVALAVVVALIWLFESAHKEQGEEEEEVTATAPHLSRGPNGEVIVVLSHGEQARIGLETEALISVRHVRELTAYGSILNPGPLAVLNAQLIAQAAALKTSRAEYARSRLLHSEKQNVSLKNLQAAQAGYQADQAQMNLLKQRLADEWGARVAGLQPDRRAQLVDELTARTAAIVRVSAPPGQALEQSPARAKVVIVGYGSHPLAARSIWCAPAINPILQGPSFLLEVKAHGLPLRSGAAITAYLQSAAAARNGVVIPTAAVVSAHGRSWAYVQIAPTRFERRQIALSEPTTGGWFVTAGFAPGDRLVVTAAQALLSEEFKSKIHIED